MPRHVTFERLWLWLQQERLALLLAVILLVLAAAPLGLPQIPDNVRGSSEALHTWLSPWQLRLPLKLEWVARLGVFSLYRSLWLKLPLALLGLTVMVRTAALCESWPVLTVRRRWSALATLTGLVFLLISGLLQWTVPLPPTLTVWPDSPITLPDGTGLPLSQVSRPVWSHDALYIPRQQALGMVVKAQGRDGHPLPLTPSAHAEGVEELRFVFDALTSEAFCAQADVGLVFRMYLTETTASSPLQVEIYRASTGELISSAQVNRSVHIFTEEVVLNLQRVNIQYVDEVSYPGWRWFVMGFVLLVAGQVIQRLRPSS